MPEFPEVYTITNNLNLLLKNSILKETEIIDYHPKISKAEGFKELENLRIGEVRNISKSIIFEFSNGKRIVSHLAMTGRFRFSETKTLFGWDKLRFTFEKDGKVFFINFTDTRKFGKLIIDEKIPHQVYPNPLNYSEEDITRIVKKIQSSSKTIKELLLDQNIFSGLGNIYSNDTLHVSKINPTIKGNELKVNEITRIINNAKEILKEGIELGGSSLYDKMYTNIFGEEGKYQNNFKVYNLKFCKDCGNEIQKIKIGGRGTYFCTTCVNKQLN